jgi:hypothetical protein
MWSDQPGREPFSIHNEVRFVMWGGVMLIASGIGVIVSKNLDRIGPLAIALALGAAAIACYIYAWIKRSLLHEYVLLLGALLLSSDAAFIEHQFHLFGNWWLLGMAVVHAGVAYAYDSRLVLSLSVAALAGWMRVERSVDAVFRADSAMGLRALGCAAILLAWRLLNRRAAFNDVLDHAMANLAFIGGLLFVWDRDPVGLLITVVAAALAVWIGLRRRAETFVIYAWIYVTAAALSFLWQNVKDETPALLGTIIITVVMVVGLGLTHARFRKARA